MQEYAHARNIHFANSYKGIYFHGTSSSNVYGSHSYFDDIFAGTFHTAVRIDSANDTMTCHNVHVSLQWNLSSSFVQAYLNTYGIGFDFHYSDNLSCADVEFYKVANALRFTNGSAIYGDTMLTHAAEHLVMSNVSFNLVPQAIAIASNTTILSAQFSNVLAQTDTDNNVAARCFIDLQTAYADVTISNFEGGSIGQGIACVGAQVLNSISNAYEDYSRLKINGIDLRAPPFPGAGGGQATSVTSYTGFDSLGGGVPAFNIAKGATVEIPTGWQNIVAGSTYSGGLTQCAMPINGGAAGSNCGRVVQPTYASHPTFP